MNSSITTASLLALLSTASAQAVWNYETLTNNGHTPYIANRTFYNGFYQADVTYLSYLRPTSDPATTTVMAASPGGGSWTAEAIESGLAYAPARISIDAYGVPHLAYFSSAPGYTVARYARRVTPNSGNCGPTHNWLCQTVPYPNIVGHISSVNVYVAAETTGAVVHFAYNCEDPNGRVNIYYVRLNGNGTWTTPELALELRNPASLVLDSDNQPNIGYVGELGSGLGGGWLHKTKIGWVHEYYGSPGIEDNDLHIFQGQLKACYSMRPGSPDEPRKVGYAERTSSGDWTLTAIGQTLPTYGASYPWDCTLSMSASGVPSIVYMASINSAVRWGTRQANGIWVMNTVASHEGPSPSIARLANDKLVVAFTTDNVIQLAREQ